MASQVAMARHRRLYRRAMVLDVVVAGYMVSLCSPFKTPSAGPTSFLPRKVCAPPTFVKRLFEAHTDPTDLLLEDDLDLRLV